MPTTSATFTDLYAPGLRKVIFESYTMYPTEYTNFLNITSSQRQYEDDYRMAGFGSVPVKPEGAVITYDDPVPDTTVRYTWTARGKGFRITHEAMADELYGQMRKMATAMGRAFKNQDEIDGSALLNQAFTAGANGGYDAAALCSTAHPLVRTGANQRNHPTAPVDLSVTALQDALVDFERVLDESGRPIVYRPKWLIIAPENVPLAREILGSQYKPFTADNEINVLANELGIMVSHYMTDPDAWFVTTTTNEHDAWWFWRDKFTTDTADDFDTGDGKMKGYKRSGIGYGDYRGWWGSPGV